MKFKLKDDDKSGMWTLHDIKCKAETKNSKLLDIYLEHTDKYVRDIVYIQVNVTFADKNKWVEALREAIRKEGYSHDI